MPSGMRKLNVRIVETGGEALEEIATRERLLKARSPYPKTCILNLPRDALHPCYLKHYIDGA
jgi:hypothetical protein